MRSLNLVDRVLHEIDQALRTVHTLAPTTDRPNPSAEIHNPVDLTDDERKKSISLMRINHAGEVSAQGLYRGQALMSKSEEIKQQMNISAMEENDHLNWCEKRLDELGSHKSYLSPVWYLGSLGIGAAAGLAGDKWSLGFVKETEDQVVRHLDSHLDKLPDNDLASRAILAQMKIDEEHHADVAVEAGAADLPFPIKKMLMPLLSKVMTKTSARI
ncbi:2-polyprenyl-3-methyl-6-methoxy-1,4-benzoquinone monooxygenase [Cocleimonas sp. KMM 6892]|uniref:2-polyprenyl-3-methyl-6-methoxy-1,4-benzoquinone monooxygenase n=1 Tax=unclassified Cocleimonas TaxID=2639732 RepID=UPI002DBF931C|nr:MULTISPECIES: 2-polyprenyl-3-methyl-6-methoxy-1,4-benzoquinone monooxygenase [unclassified Cocleimonas]MEB8432386.1 2-polyprenyl-3-methyl-6-methoxy-1,4-benzoquinone monooxygenase [Cocleimonas sp. KMM 6892]MEC4715245.1 2-polyprenyl-3-methyl-6-methoxy-1,4-benzoquinone monooxygenase [Cocleimonas sp. KMM 6895]MEC4745136.1 2-polyprenyl-3-methyl-6-methoxy-1,4-benzoquinone monooxygenase [Cocleimonas sp. KMM 6896]